MRLDSLFYRLAYRFSRPRWDTAEPRPELKELVGGHQPGRALDLGCGTGTDAIYLGPQPAGRSASTADHLASGPGTAR